MDTNSKLMQVHEFSKGMMPDISDSTIPNSAYKLANNLRYITESEENSGELHIIEGARLSYDFGDKYKDVEFTVLASTQIRQYGVLVLKDQHLKWYVFRFTNPYYTSELDKDQIHSKDFRSINVDNMVLVFGPCSEQLGEKISVVTRYEDWDNVKLYIADGVHSQMVINLMLPEYFKAHSDSQTIQQFVPETNINKVISYPFVSFKKPIFCGLINGNLKSGVVLYSYQLYNLHGNQSEVSPSTKLISLHYGDFNISQTNKIGGYELGKITDKGVKIRIDMPDQLTFTNIVIYRITYQQVGQLPTIEMILDRKISDTKSMYFNDVGQSALKVLSVEEYNSMTGIHVIPKIIESKDEYMFASNIKTDNRLETIEEIKNWDARAFRYDLNGKCHLYSYSTDLLFNGDTPPLNHDAFNKYNDMSIQYNEDSTLYRDGEGDRFTKSNGGKIYYGGTGKNVSWRFVVTEVTGDASKVGNEDLYAGRIGSETPYISINDNAQFRNDNIKCKYVLHNGDLDDTSFNADALDFFDTNLYNYSYANPSVSYYLKSLRRDELYRFGIVLYDKFGNTSSVKWIADIRTPNMNWRGFNTFVSHGQTPTTTEDKYTEDLVVRPLGIEFTVDTEVLKRNNIIGYEIVRVGRTESDICTIQQGVISRPVVHYTEMLKTSKVEAYPFTPTGWIHVNGWWDGYSKKLTDWGDNRYYGRLAMNNGVYGSIKQAIDVNRTNGYSIENRNIYQFISPEYTYQSDTIKSILDNQDVTLNPLLYLFGYNYNNSDSYEEDWRRKNDNDSLVTTTTSHDTGERGDEYISGPLNVPPSKWIYPGANKYTHLPVNYANYTINKQLSYKDLLLQASKYLYGKYVKANSARTIRTGMSYSEAGVLKSMFDYSVTIDYSKLSFRGKTIVKNNEIVDWDLYKEFFKSQALLFFSLYGIDQHDLLIIDDILNRHVFNEAVGWCRSIGMYNKTDVTNAYYKLELTNNIGFNENENGNDLFLNVMDIPNRYQYIKLYESTNQVYINNIRVNPFLVYSPKVDKNISINTIDNLNIKITDVAYPDTHRWDGLAEKTTNGDKVQYPLAYSNKITEIGGYSYCNWVSGGMFNVPVQDTATDKFYLSNDEWLNDLNSKVGGMLGPAGKTMLIALDNTDYLCETNFASSTYKTTTGGLNNIDRVEADLKYLTVTGSDLDSFVLDDKVKQIYRESILGTYLCNMRKNTVPYGGYDATSREMNTYYSYGDYHNIDEDNNKHCVFNGDCFIQPFEYVSLHKWYHPLVKYPRNACIVYSIPVETNINLALTYGNEFSKNMFTTNGDITNLQVEASNVYNKYIQDKDLYVYNSVYSLNTNVRQFAPQIIVNDDTLDNLDYRTYHSNQKDNNEAIDSWTKYMSANYIDVDTRHGAITGLRKFKNQLIFWQEEATGMFSVNERTAITDDSNMLLVLGSAGVLNRYDYFNTSNGMHHDQYCDTQSDATLYWWDYNKHELCAYSGGEQPIVLSKVKSVQNIFNKLYNSGQISKQPLLIFDKRFNELIGYVTDGIDVLYGSIVYSEVTQQFLSMYSINPTGSISFADRLYLVNNKALIFEWNQKYNNEVLGIQYEEDGLKKLYPYLQYIVNDQQLYTKVFDNVEFGGRFYGGDSKYENVQQDEHDNVGLEHLSFEFRTPLKQHGKLKGSDIENREYNFRFSVPRNNDEDYGGRLRGKTMRVDMYSNSNSYDFSLQYLITKYRISWS